MIKTAHDCNGTMGLAIVLDLVGGGGLLGVVKNMTPPPEKLLKA